ENASRSGHNYANHDTGMLGKLTIRLDDTQKHGEAGYPQISHRIQMQPNAKSRHSTIHGTPRENARPGGQHHSKHRTGIADNLEARSARSNSQGNQSTLNQRQQGRSSSMQSR